MKVKVSYTVDLDDVPNKIKEIVKKNEDSIKEISELSVEIASGDLGAKSLRHLARMKTLSENMTERYSDCESILTGFLRSIFASSNTEEEIANDDNA